ncbi:hypothetical protein J4462_01905 [Candidatus Pacearchaeota archaeon]|nr:hypothetical protein [Candidatus Pacearchaeota archaeon]
MRTHNTKKMKRGLSPIVATVLLVSLVIVLATILLLWSRTFISDLDPEVNCEGVEFDAEIYESGGAYNLIIVNTGTVEIKGAVIQLIGESELQIKEEVDLIVEGGATQEDVLENFAVGDEGNYFVVPKIEVQTSDKDIIVKCPDDVGIEIFFGE